MPGRGPRSDPISGIFAYRGHKRPRNAISSSAGCPKGGPVATQSNSSSGCLRQALEQRVGALQRPYGAPARAALGGKPWSSARRGPTAALQRTLIEIVPSRAYPARAALGQALEQRVEGPYSGPPAHPKKSSRRGRSGGRPPGAPALIKLGAPVPEGVPRKGAPQRTPCMPYKEGPCAESFCL